ncbi:DUF4374 domain-containing protein [Sphingobacterium paludis]|jgi:hypothetical protein|uniref:Uncharacterized protein DUF4374 n=1 Tax=Sphingobacterium paludis TaxID=1476465 RepID=A0A4R7D3Y3_9SPHI|nr:DUF4374 domain-containing protein [Sphingobacterium paludis]TDS15773.1 uncharacterized protein DUF4374 [Sphingobacterium paludis]
MKTNKLINLAVATILSFSAFSCKSDNPTPDNGNKGNFVLAVTPVASTAVADYLVTANDLESGTVSILGNGIEQDGTYRYYVTHNNKFFSMLYGQSNPGAVTTYEVTDGKLTRLKNFTSETVQAFAPVNDDILMLKIPRAITNPFANYYQVNTNSLTITKEGTINTQDILKNGETAFFTWIKQVGNKVYAPFMSIKACCNGAFDTAYPNNAWIAVYSYPDMTFEKVISDDRTSFIGRYFRDGLAIDEKGDVYAFSSSVATANGTLNSTKPSAITRVSAGTTEFDKSYYFDIEAVSNGKNITNWIYVGQGKFVVQMTTKEEKGNYTDGKHIGIVDVYNKTFKDVTGMPDISTIKAVTYNNYTPKNGVAYIGIATTEAVSFVYKIDASTATATQGLRVEGGSITAVSRVN